MNSECGRGLKRNFFLVIRTIIISKVDSNLMIVDYLHWERIKFLTISPSKLTQNFLSLLVIFELSSYYFQLYHHSYRWIIVNDQVEIIFYKFIKFWNIAFHHSHDIHQVSFWVATKIAPQSIRMTYHSFHSVNCW